MYRLLGDDNDTNMGILDTPRNLHEKLHVDLYESASIPRTNEKVSLSKDAKGINIRITPFGQRINKFTSQFDFNPHNAEHGLGSTELEKAEDDIITRVQPIERCNLQVYSLLPESGCRFMHDRTVNRVINIIIRSFIFLIYFIDYCSVSLVQLYR